VAPPRHDELEGEGVFPITGSPHRVTPAKLDEALARFQAKVDPLPHPRIAVLIGGKSKAFDISPERARGLADQIAAMIAGAGGSLMVTFSRRTPLAARAIMAERFASLPGMVWDGSGENPYFAFLAAADAFVVTEDSINMVAEAASTGKPIHIAAVDGAQRRKRLFHADLAERGIARPFTGEYSTWAYEPLQETDRMAAEIVRRLNLG
jgi:mitochondrial fission protein ELM1